MFRYINCTLGPGGQYTQYNMMCPGDLVYANEYRDCVDYDRATDCKIWTFLVGKIHVLSLSYSRCSRGLRA